MADGKGKTHSDAKGLTGDGIFSYDEDYVDLLRKEAPWKKDRKYFNKCKVSALAAMKMLKHALAGVDKGRKAGTNPVEVMGLMVGKPEGNTIVVTDVCALPVEGTETKVIADDALPYMARLSDALENRRMEKFVGWYHSHPFDVTTYSHCHLSATDVQTQQVWQANSPFWTAIVVDPLRSMARQEPEFGAFRCYPIDHIPPKTLCPDGATMTDHAAQVQRWGMTCGRYYSLEISYFMSSLGSSVLNVMSRNSLWIRVLSSSAVMEAENRERFADRVQNATTKIDAAATHMPHGGRYAGPRGDKAAEELADATQACSELACEQIRGHISQVSKDLLFNHTLETAEAKGP